MISYDTDTTSLKEVSPFRPSPTLLVLTWYKVGTMAARNPKGSFRIGIVIHNYARLKNNKPWCGYSI